MIVAHTSWIDDKIFFGKTEGNRNDIGPSFIYLNQTLQEFEIWNLTLMGMVSSVLHLLSNAFFTTFTFYVPQTTWLAVKALEPRVFCTPNNVFLLICSPITYMEVYIDIRCTFSAWRNFAGKFFTSKQRKMFNVHLNMCRKWVILSFLKFSNTYLNCVTHLKKTRTDIQMKFYKVVARPALLYGSETWVTTKRDMTRLEAAEMRFLRSVKGYTRLDKVRREFIRWELEISGIQDVRSKHKQNRINHLERVDNTRLPKHALNYKPRGRRDRGRPRKRRQRVNAGTVQTT